MKDISTVLPEGTPVELRQELENSMQRVFTLLLEIFMPPGGGAEREGPQAETYGLNPDAWYNDSELQQMCGVTDKTTYRWRKNKVIAYLKGNGKKKSGRISYQGRFIIDFYRLNRVAQGLKPLKPIFKEVPQGHM